MSRMNSDFARKPQFWAAAFALFSLVALSQAAQNYTGLYVRRHEFALWRYALVGTLPFWYSKLVLLPMVVVAGRRWSLNERWGRNVPVQLLVSLLFAAVQLTLGMAVAWTILPPPGRTIGFTGELLNLFTTHFVTGVVFYWVFLGLFHAISYAQELQAQKVESRELALQASELQTQLAQARLSALRSQLNPHFLFNALNAVGALCDRRDTKAASEMVTRIGELLRIALDDHAQLTTLERELQFVEAYLKVEQVRLGARLMVVHDVPAYTLGVSIPSLMIQALVENAIRHGIGQKPGPGMIRISARLRGGRLILDVEDNGPGFDYPRAGPRRNGDGVGLHNSIARLEHLYGKSARLAVDQSAIGGARVRVTIPVAGATMQRA